MAATLFVTGRLGRDGAQEKETSKGTRYVGFSLASDRMKNDERGAMWLNCEVWNGCADRMLAYLKQGTGVVVTGRFDTREYENKDGVNKTELKLTVFDIQFAQGGNNKDGENGGGGNRQQAKTNDWNNSDADDWSGGDSDDKPW
jgi:single-strand DNA-binding protein